MLGTGQDGGECCGKAIGEVDPSTLGKNNLVKINGCSVVIESSFKVNQLAFPYQGNNTHI